MNLKSFFTAAILCFFFILCVPSLAYAGRWTVLLRQDDSNVTLRVLYADGSDPTVTLFGADSPLEILVGDQDNIEAAILLIVSPDGTRTISVLEVTVSNSLPSLEPFEIPNFRLPNPGTLTSTIDLNAFLAAGNPFTVGQTFSVINGTTPLTDAIVFTDEFGNPFTGIATVDPFYRVDPIPEPTAILLLGTGLAGVAVKMRKRLKSAKS